MKLLFFTPKRLLTHLEDSFSADDRPTIDDIEDAINNSDYADDNYVEWDCINVEGYTPDSELIHLLNQAHNYDDFAVLHGDEPYYKYFTQ